MPIAVALWSLSVSPGKPVSFIPQCDLRITNAALGDELADASARTSVKVTYSTPVKVDDDDDENDDDGTDPLTTTVLCSLTPGKIEQATIDLIVEEDEELIFEAVGKNTIYLSGNYVDQGPENVPFNDESDFDEDEEAYDLREVSSDVEMHPDGLESDDEGRFEEIADVVKEQAAKEQIKSLKRPRESDATEGGEKKLSKAEKKRLKKLKAEGGEARPAEVEVEAKAGGEEKKKKKKEKASKGEKEASKAPEEKDDDAPAAKDAVVKEVAGGVKVKDLVVGQGQQAKKGDTVSMRYVGKLQNGKVFDKNVKGEPFSFSLGKGEVIKGWDEGIVGMQVGGKRLLTIPPNMAYGNKQIPNIPAGSTLTFDCKLLGIKR